MGFIAGAPHLIAMMLSQPSLFFRAARQQSSKRIQLGGTDGLKKRLDHDLLNRWAIQRHALGSVVMALEAITQVAHVRFVRDPHAVPTHATTHEPLQHCLPLPYGSTRSLHGSLLRMGFLGVFGETCL